MSQLLEVLLLAAHLLCVNLASAAPLVVIWWDWREGRGDVVAGQAGRSLAGAAVVAAIVGPALGVALGAVVWDEAFRLTLSRLHDRVFYGVLEWITSLALMVIHYYWWKARPAAKTGERIARCLLALAAGTNLIYHFPVLFYVIRRIDAIGPPLTSGEFRELLADPEVLWRSLHFAAAAFATCGVMLTGYALRRLRSGDEQAAVRLGKAGGHLGLWFTLPQLLIGFMVVLSTPKSAQARLMGGDVLTSGLFVVSLFSAFYLMHALAKAAFRFDRSAAVQSMIMLVVVVVLMSWVSLRA